MDRADARGIPPRNVLILLAMAAATWALIYMTVAALWL